MKEKNSNNKKKDIFKNPQQNRFSLYTKKIFQPLTPKAKAFLTVKRNYYYYVILLILNCAGYQKDIEIVKSGKAIFPLFPVGIYTFSICLYVFMIVKLIMNIKLNVYKKHSIILICMNVLLIFISTVMIYISISGKWHA